MSESVQAALDRMGLEVMARPGPAPRTGGATAAAAAGGVRTGGGDRQEGAGVVDLVEVTAGRPANRLPAYLAAAAPAPLPCRGCGCDVAPEPTGVGAEFRRPELCAACAEAERWKGQRRAAAARFAARIDRQYKAATPATLDARYRAELLAWMETEDGPRVALFSGPPGVGKTWTAWALARGLADDADSLELLPVVLPLGEWFGKLRERACMDPDARRAQKRVFGEPEGPGQWLCEGGREWPDVEAVATWRGLVVLDDLPEERATELVREAVFQVVDGRWRSWRPVLVTTNLSLADIAQRYGAKLASRIGSGRRFAFSGPDRRVSGNGRAGR